MRGRKRLAAAGFCCLWTVSGGRVVAVLRAGGGTGSGDSAGKRFRGGGLGAATASDEEGEGFRMAGDVAR